MKLCPQGCEFYFRNGAVASNVEELAVHIANLSDEHYMHHVNEEKNDFHTWMKDCIDARKAKAIAGNINRNLLLEKLSAPAKKQTVAKKTKTTKKK